MTDNKILVICIPNISSSLKRMSGNKEIQKRMSENKEIQKPENNDWKKNSRAGNISNSIESTLTQVDPIDCSQCSKCIKL